MLTLKKPSIESCLKAPKLWLLVAVFCRSRREAGGDLMRLQWMEEMLLNVVDVVEQSCVKWVQKQWILVVLKLMHVCIDFMMFQ